MQPAIATPLRTFKLLAAALMGALVVIGIALSFVVGNETTNRAGRTVHNHAPAAWVYVVVIVLGVVAAALCQAFGYRIEPIKPGTDAAQARTLSLAAYQRTMFLRFAFSETVAIISIALLFVAQSNTVLPYIVGAVISELLLAYHVWPSTRLIERVQERLDRDGGASNLANALNGAA